MDQEASRLATLGVRAGTGAQPVQRALRSAVPHLELRLRERRAGRGALRRRRAGHRLLALHQPHRRACSRTAWPRSKARRAASPPPRAWRRSSPPRWCHAEGRRPRGVLDARVRRHRPALQHACSGASASRPPTSSPTRIEEWQRGDAAQHAAAVPRDAVEPADRDLRHRGARRSWRRRRARCSWSTTSSARRRCSGRSSSAPTS